MSYTKALAWTSAIVFIGIFVLLNLKEDSSKENVEVLLDPRVIKQKGEGKSIEIEPPLPDSNRALGKIKKHSLDSSDHTNVEYANEFDEKWCILSERSEIEQLQYIKHLNEWNAERGAVFSDSRIDNLYSNNPVAVYSSETYGSEYLLEPYKEESIESLEEMAHKGDWLAMLQLLDTSGVSMDKKEWFAYELLVRDKTPASLIELVTINLTKANFYFEQDESISARVKTSVMDALTYASYGLSRLDESGLIAYLVSMQNNPAINSELKAKEVLSNDVLESIDFRVEALQHQLNNRRSDLSLYPLEQTEFPDIARVSLYSAIASVKYLYGEELGELAPSAFGHRYSNLNENTCVKQQYNRLQER